MIAIKKNYFTPFVNESEWKKQYPEVDREYIWAYPLIHGPDTFNPENIFKHASASIVSNDLVVYIHLPACLFRCPMCPFYVEVIHSRDEIAGYADNVIREFSFYEQSGILEQYNLKAIYFGGGTASLFRSEDIRDICKAVTDALHCSMDSVEITVEGHPITVDYDYLSAIREYGVNRVSFGIQSFDDDTLKKLGLRQTVEKNKSVLNDSMKLGFRTVSADMLYRTPGQTINGCVDQLNQFLDTGIQSLSAYSLELSVREGELQKHQPNEEVDRQMFYAINETLERAGWFHTAQPDYSKIENVSKETVVTWRAPQGQILGLGAGACSTINANIYFNVHNIEEYANVLEAGCLPILTGQKFTLDDAMSRYLVLGTRCFIIPRQDFKHHFGVDIIDRYAEEIEYLVQKGLIEIYPDHLQITKQGKYYVDNISKCFYSHDNKGHLQPWGERMKGAVATSYMEASKRKETCIK